MKKGALLVLLVYVASGCGYTSITADAHMILCERREGSTFDTREIVLREDRTVNTLVSKTTIQFDDDGSEKQSYQNYLSFMETLYQTTYVGDSGIQWSNVVDDNQIQMIVTYDFNSVSEDSLARVGLPLEHANDVNALTILVKNYEAGGFECHPYTPES